MKINKGSKAKIRYEVDLHIAGRDHDGLSGGIINILAYDHDEEYCTTCAVDVVVRNAIIDVLVKATEALLIRQA